MADIIAGIDVGKRRLDVSIAQGTVTGFDNTQAGIAALLAHLARHNVAHAVCEATGGYERDVVRELYASGLTVNIAHPPKVRHFARAAGYEAKTDVLDARVLARYGEIFPLASEQPDADQQEVKELTKRRQDLVDQRAREKNRLEKAPRGGAARRSAQRHIDWLTGEIERLEEEHRAAVERNPHLSELTALYQSVPGVGAVTAASLVAYLPELGTCDGKALTALAGLAPWAKDSGGQRRPRSIRGGRGAVRRALYLAALSAIKHNEDLRRFYTGLRKRGKTGKVALVAVMRKLLLLLNAIAQRGTAFTTTPPIAPTA